MEEIQLINKNTIFKVIPYFKSEWKSISDELKLQLYRRGVYTDLHTNKRLSDFEVLSKLKSIYHAKCEINSENPDLFSISPSVKIIYIKNDFQEVAFKTNEEVNLFLKQLHDKDTQFVEIKVDC